MAVGRVLVLGIIGVRLPSMTETVCFQDVSVLACDSVPLCKGHPTFQSNRVLSRSQVKYSSTFEAFETATSAGRSRISELLPQQHNCCGLHAG
jgi:hypothetical protein